MNENNYIVATIPDEPKGEPQYFSGQDEYWVVLFMADWRQATPMTQPQAVQLAHELESVFSLRHKKFEAVCLDELAQGKARL